MRNIDLIIIHCSATSPAMDIGYDEIDLWHKKRGFNQIGYHYIIRRDGLIEQGRPLEKIGAHCKGHNAKSIGICLVGGIDSLGNEENNFSIIQFDALKKLLIRLKSQFPNAVIKGHRDFSAKACPCFDVEDFCKKIGLVS